MISDVNYPSWPNKSAKSHFSQYQFNISNNKLFWELLKNDCNNLYLHSKSFNMSLWRSHLCLASIYRGGPVDLPTLHFPTYIWQKQWQLHLLLERSLKIGCNNLYFHCKILNVSLKSNLYLMPISRHDPSKSVKPQSFLISMWHKR